MAPFVVFGADATSSSLFSIDRATGEAYDFVATSIPFSSVGIEFDPRDRSVWAVTKTALYKADVDTGDTTYISTPSGVDNIDDLTFYPTCE